jgi:hypothetical protein
MARIIDLSCLINAAREHDLPCVDACVRAIG